MINVSDYQVAVAETSFGIRASVNDRLVAGAVLAILGLLIIAAYFSPHIWHHGEAREGLVVQDIVTSHRWVLPLRNGELPSKPILYHWMAASFAMLLGLSDFAVRLPSVVGAAVLVWVTYSVAAAGANRRTGLLAVGILASTFEFWDSGTEARVDMLFASLIGLSLAGWYAWYRSGREIARAAAYSGIALAVLAKGPAGAILPGLVIICFLVVQRDLWSLGKFFSWPWIAVVLAIDVGWYLAAFQRGGMAFWHKQIVYENVDRFFGTPDFQTPANGAPQVVRLITQLFPWSLVLLAAPILWIRGRRQDSLGRFLHSWWLAILGFFSFAAGGRAVYLLPIYPAVAVLAARELAAFLDARQKDLYMPRSRIKTWCAAAAVIAVVDLSFGAAVPISRTVQEDSSGQEEFVEAVVPKIFGAPALYAAPDFPETARMVLSYRLKRAIHVRAMTCSGDYYYLTSGNPVDSCSTIIATTGSHSRKQTLRLLLVSDAAG